MVDVLNNWNIRCAADFSNSRCRRRSCSLAEKAKYIKYLANPELLSYLIFLFFVGINQLMTRSVASG